MNVFLNLDSSDFLLEYIYYDSASPEIINTTNAPFYLMQNGHDGSSLVMNQDAYGATSNNTSFHEAFLHQCLPLYYVFLHQCSAFSW